MNKYILTAACGLAFSAASAQTKALPDSPNILLILVDDLGFVLARSRQGHSNSTYR